MGDMEQARLALNHVQNVSKAESEDDAVRIYRSRGTVISALDRNSKQGREDLLLANLKAVRLH